jgi:hypothetical protein
MTETAEKATEKAPKKANKTDKKSGFVALYYDAYKDGQDNLTGDPKLPPMRCRTWAKSTDSGFKKLTICPEIALGVPRDFYEEMRLGDAQCQWGTENPDKKGFFEVLEDKGAIVKFEAIDDTQADILAGYSEQDCYEIVNHISIIERLVELQQYEHRKPILEKIRSRLSELRNEKKDTSEQPYLERNQDFWGYDWL